jgi:hypothetical protein
MPTEDAHEEQFSKDIQEGLARVMKENPDMAAEEALRIVTSEMLANNPFVPPVGCPINDLPNEILGLIFMTGLRIEEEEGGDEEEDEDYINLAEDWIDTDEEGQADDILVEEDGMLIEGTVVDGDGPLFIVKTPTSAFPAGMALAEGISPTPYSTKIPSLPSPSTSSMEVDPEMADIVIPVEGSAADQDMEGAVDAPVEKEPFISFPILVSHVCRRWRDVAISTPGLWTKLIFGPDSWNMDKTIACLERSKGHPLDICFDSVVPDDWEPPVEEETANEDSENPVAVPPALTVTEVDSIMDMLQPHVHRWRVLEVQSSSYDVCYAVLRRIADIPSAESLETLQFYHYEDCEDFTRFNPTSLATKFLPFRGKCPRLRQLALWGAHIDWDGALPLFKGLTELELAYHAHDVRPSFETFKSILQSATDLNTLALCLTGPSGSLQDWGEPEPIDIPSVRTLILYHHDCRYILDLFPLLHVPNANDLKLDYDGEDFTAFAKMLCTPQKPLKRSILSGLEKLKIGGLPCDRKTLEDVLGQLSNVRELTLNCSDEDIYFLFEKLQTLRKTTDPSASGPKVTFCPELTHIKTTGIDGKEMQKFVETRIKGGAPLKSLLMSEEDHVGDREEEWLRGHVQELDFFEPSSEEEYSDDEIVIEELSDQEHDDEH